MSSWLLVMSRCYGTAKQGDETRKYKKTGNMAYFVRFPAFSSRHMLQFLPRSLRLRVYDRGRATTSRRVFSAAAAAAVAFCSWWEQFLRVRAAAPSNTRVDLTERRLSS